MGSKFLKAVVFTCVIGGAAFLWSGYWSEELESGSDQTSLDEVVTRGQPNIDIAIRQERISGLSEFIPSGWVIDTAGNGIAKALLIVENTPEETFSVLTQEDGSFVLGPLAAGNPVAIEISAQGFIPGYVKIEANEPNVLVTLLKTGRLEGNTIDIQSNRPVENFTVSLFADDKLNISKVPDASAIFHDQSGEFAIIDLEHKQMDLFARADGYQPVILHSIAVSDQTDNVELRFDKARAISGRVISASSAEAIPGAEVYVWNSPPYIEHPRRIPYPGQSTKTSENGTFSLDEVTREAVTLYIQVNEYVFKTVEVGQSQEGDIEVLLAPASSVAGRLFGVDGSSPEVGGIHLLELETGRSGGTRSRDDGRFVLHLPPGDYVLSASSSAGKSGQIELTLGEGEHIDNLRLQILPGNELTGRVSGLMPGETALGVQANRPGQSQIGKKANSAGNYALRGLPTGMIEIVAKTSKGRSLSKFVELQATTVAYLDFIFDGTASIYGRITRDGVPIKNTSINLIPVDRDQPRGRPYTSEDGHYSIEGLANGKYMFNVNGEGKRYITLSGRTQLDVDL